MKVTYVAFSLLCGIFSLTYVYLAKIRQSNKYTVWKYVTLDNQTPRIDTYSVLIQLVCNVTIILVTSPNTRVQQ